MITRRRWRRRQYWPGIFVCLLLSGLALSGPARGADWQPTLLLVSLDGFRPDYQDRTKTPTLDLLTAGGVRAEALIPSFPTKTFPNHYTLVTGLYPANHGIVANTMYDPVMEDAYFSIRKREPQRDGRWYDGEPIWVTAERQGQIAATFFWVGSNADIGGRRATYEIDFDGSIPYAERVAQILAWLDLPDDKRPTFLTLYIEAVDSAGHHDGPESDEVLVAVRRVDRILSTLIAGLKQRNLLEKVDILITSDHGMAARSPEKIIFLDDYIDLSSVQIVDYSPITALRPKKGNGDDILAALQGAHPHFHIYRRSELPERFHYRDHRRIQPLIGIADEGWSVTNHTYFTEHADRFGGGAHGYDNALRSMNALFIAHGPSFRKGIAVPSFQNIHVYNLMCRVLGLEPAANDGVFSQIEHLLADHLTRPE